MENVSYTIDSLKTNSTSASPSPVVSFKRSLSLFDATMVVVGILIGSGIFILSSVITRNVGSAGWLVTIWAIAGLMTLCAALSYGELSGMFPKAGGQYVYLKEAYNPLVGFLFGWSYLSVIQTASIAAVAVAFAKFTAYLAPQFSEDLVAFDLGFLKISPAQLMAMFIIILLTYINSKGINIGKTVQTSLTSIKVVSLLGLIVFGFIMMRADVWNANWKNGWNLHKVSPKGVIETYTSIATLGAIAAALSCSLFSNQGWNNVAFIAGEIKNPKRNIGLSLLFGTIIVTALYIATNLMYTAVLPMNEIANADKDRVAVAASDIIFGTGGSIIIAIIIMISTFSCDNGLILAGARIYYSMARDGIFFRKAGELNKNAVPGFALWMQCAIACVWCLSGKYSQLVEMISFVVVLFYILTIAGIVILRKYKPHLERPYKAIGYPLLPILYIAMGSTLCILLISYKPQYTWAGLILVLVGIPIYFIAISSRKPFKPMVVK